VTPLQDGAFDATITLSDHGRRTIELPADDVTADAADHPDIARGPVPPATGGVCEGAGRAPVFVL